MERKRPLVVLCLGLPGSASTWVFNVALHLQSLPKRALVAAYIDDRFADFWQALQASPEPVEAVVLKSHKAEPALFDFLSAHPSRCVLSVRDPRDCIVSLMERFDFSFAAALAALQKSCDALMLFQRLGGPLLRYEECFFRASHTIVALHRYLDDSQPVDIGRVARLHSRAAIDRLIGTFDGLPAGRIRKQGSDEYDLVSHWHRNHFGDGLTDKWRTRLSPAQIEQASQVLAPALAQWHYPLSAEWAEAG